MKLGDLIKVRYTIAHAYGGYEDGWGEAHTGIVVSTPSCGDYSTWQMWCIETRTCHVLMPDLDLIEVISESRRPSKVSG